MQDASYPLWENVSKKLPISKCWYFNSKIIQPVMYMFLLCVNGLQHHHVQVFMYVRHILNLPKSICRIFLTQYILLISNRWLGCNNLSNLTLEQRVSVIVDLLALMETQCNGRSLCQGIGIAYQPQTARDFWKLKFREQVACEYSLVKAPQDANRWRCIDELMILMMKYVALTGVFHHGNSKERANGVCTWVPCLHEQPVCGTAIFRDKEKYNIITFWTWQDSPPTYSCKEIYYTTTIWQGTTWLKNNTARLFQSPLKKQ